MSAYIKDIICSTKFVPLNRPFITALHEVDAIKGIQVQVILSDGVIGIGAATANEKVTGDTTSTVQEVIETVIKPQLLSRDLLDWNNIISALHDCIVHNTSAKAAVEIALFQARAQETQQSLVNLLGGQKGEVSTDYTISIGTDDQMVSEAKQLVDQGFTSIKIKLGSHSINHDIRTIEKISAAIGPEISLRIDCNQAWNCKRTLMASRIWSSEKLNIDFIEQPVKKDAINDLAVLTRESEIPIMVDESVASYSDAIRVINQHACDYINIKLMKTGGLSEAIKINDLAQASGINTMIGCMIEPVESISAAVAFAVANNNVKFVDLDSIFMVKENKNVNKYLKMKNNKILLK